MITYNALGHLKKDEGKINSISRDFDNWYGPLYVNSEDPRFLVQKKQAEGYTINFGNPIGIILPLLSLGLLQWAIYSGL